MNKQLLEEYNKGWNDELNNTVDNCNNSHAYNLGRVDALIGDEISSNDLQTVEEILSRIKNIKTLLCVGCFTIDYFPEIQDVNIIWIPDYLEFVNYITNNKLPNLICFYEALEEDFKCVEWLTDYCMENEFFLPKWIFYSNYINPKEYNDYLKNSL